MRLWQAFYDQKLELLFLKAKGDEFQTFFERLMGLAYKSDFMACRPWGRSGDRKNDGFLKSERRLFQVYAPNDMSEAVAVAKITEDFKQARIHWGSDFDKWTFVHNACDGLGPHIQKLLLDFERSHPGIKLEPWGLEELRMVFRKLSVEDLISWFGYAPDDETRTNLGFKELQVVIQSVTGKDAVPDGAVAIVSPRKLDANDLSQCVITLIRNGMAKAPLVADFFDRWHDHALGERIAVAFREEYARLQSGNRHPNLIFSDLQAWVGGLQRGTAEHEMAILSVLAYFFERCDIFEEPRDA